MFFLVKEDHSYDNDQMVTDQVLDHVMQNMIICEGYVFLKGKEMRTPKGFVIGRFFFADIKVQTCHMNPSITIDIYMPRWMSMKWHTKKTVADASICLGASSFGNTNNNSMTTNLTVDNLDTKKEKQMKTTYKCLMKNNNYINSRYGVYTRAMLLKTQYDYDTYTFALQFTKTHIDLFKNGDVYNYKMILFGKPGIGKTTIAKCIANQIDGYLLICNPTMPGSNILEVLNYTHEKPVVILIDEADRVLKDIQMGLPQVERDTCRDIFDKGSWNMLMDTFKDMPNIILILTMNSTPIYMDQNIDRDNNILNIDPSLLRKGRFDMFYEINLGNWTERVPLTLYNDP